MANTFNRSLLKLTTTGNTTVYTVPSATVTIIKSVYCANISAIDTTVDLYIDNGVTTFYLIKNGIVPDGTTLQIITEPVVVSAGDLIVAKANDANTIDVTCSYMEIT